MTKHQTESYTLADFSAEDWWFRPPHDGSDGIDFDYLSEIHKTEGNMIFASLSETTEGFWYAVHLSVSAFEIYVYEVDGWSPGKATPNEAYPVIWVYGTTFDGVRETHGCPASTANLKGFSAILLEVDRYIEAQGWGAS